jgi:Helix-turn-helix domain
MSREDGANSNFEPGSTGQDPFRRKILDDRNAADEVQSFTSQKLDLLNAIGADPRLTHADFHVAFWLIQHVNSNTGQCNPSQKLIAEYAHMEERSVRGCIRRLCESGWLQKCRKGRGSNHYRFDERNVSAMLDRLTSIRDRLNLERSYRLVDAGQEALHRHEDAAHNRNEDAAKHLSGTPE